MIRKHKKIFSSLVAMAFASSVMAASSIVAYKVEDDVSKVNPDSSCWKKAQAVDVVLYPQTTIKINDKKTNDLNENAKSKVAKVQAVTDGTSIAFKLTWADGTQSIQSGKKSDEYSDGFAVQLPLSFNNLDKLPYIGMGSKDRPVMVYLQKAVAEHWEPNGNGDVEHQLNIRNTHAFNSSLDNSLEKFNIEVNSQKIKSYSRTFVSEGFRSLTQIKDGSAKFDTNMKYGKANWSATLNRPLNDDYVKIYSDTFPVSFAIWDGDKQNRDGLKLISSWVAVKIQDSKGSQHVEQLIGKVNADLPNADVKNGAKLAKDNCAACHQYGNVKDAPRFMAPNLTNIGGYSTTEYLKESIINPNAVVVPGYNRNAHSNYQWYYDDGNGGRTSAMPPFSHLNEKEITDIVAFLKTLKADVNNKD